MIELVERKKNPKNMGFCCGSDDRVVEHSVDDVLDPSESKIEFRDFEIEPWNTVKLTNVFRLFPLCRSTTEIRSGVQGTTVEAIMHGRSVPFSVRHLPSRLGSSGLLW